FVSARTNDLYLLPPVVTYLTGSGQDCTAIIDDGSSASWQITRSLNNTLRSGQTVLVEKIEPDADPVPAVRRILGGQPDSVVYGGGWRGLGAVAQALADGGYTGARLATNAAFDPRFPARAGGAA